MRYTRRFPVLAAVALVAIVVACTERSLSDSSQLSPTASQLSALVEQDDLAFKEPIWVMRDGVILDGYARWELARKQGRSTLTCSALYKLTP